MEFGNPDLVRYAESFGIAGFRSESAADDYRESLRLTERLGSLMEAG